MGTNCDPHDCFNDIFAPVNQVSRKLKDRKMADLQYAWGVVSFSKNRKTVEAFEKKSKNMGYVLANNVQS